MFAAPAPLSLNLGGRLFALDRPMVMGILNLTTDSFFAASRYGDKAVEDLVGRAQQLLSEGADLLDLGAMSTRPGAAEVSAAEEMARLDVALAALRKALPDVLISVDTYRAEVARQCVEHWGVQMINDISGGELDRAMLSTVARLGVPYVLTHMQGTPQTMQHSPHYDDVTAEVVSYIAQRAQRFYDYGGTDVIADPGFGFGKTVAHNYTLFQQLEDFHELRLPLLVGISRKSMIYRPLQLSPETALNGTTALHMLALTKGAHILRVHDVGAAVEACRLFAFVQQPDLAYRASEAALAVDGSARRG